MKISIALGLLALALAAGCGGGDRPPSEWRTGPALPAEFPKDVPVYPNATIVTATAEAGGPGMVVVWRTTDKTEAVRDFLSQGLTAQGWHVTTYPGVVAKWMGDAGVSVVATRWGRQVSFAVGEQGDAQVITFVIAGKG